MHRRILAILAIGVIGASTTASAASFSSLTIFGDSLSDTGNIFLATGGTVPTAPYFDGRFSNGPVWVETLAAELGLAGDAAPALAGGKNFAFGGARTGTDSPPPGLLAQVGGLWAPANALADPTGLYLLVGGGNDMRDARSGNPTDSAADQAGRQAAAEAAIANLVGSLNVLAAKGAKSVLIGNLPDLGATPEAVGLGLVAPSSDASARFNALMPFLLDTGTALGLEMYFFDLAGFAADVRDDALNNGGAVYGITNALTPCGVFPGSIGISCNVSLFSDALHPTARAHQLAGLAAFAALMQGNGTVTEPGSLALLAIGLLLMAVPGLRLRVPVRRRVLA